MSEKNFASYGDMETLVTEIVDKCGPYTEISYEDWLQLTPYQQEHGRWDVTGVPGADGTVSIDLMTKLWENEDPTSAFAQQDITLSSDDYNLLLIIYNWTASTPESLVNIVQKNKGFVLSAALPSASGARNMSRSGNFNSATEIHFDDGRDAVGTTASSTNNGRCIPIVIYGIKLHHTVEIAAIAPNASTLAKKCVFDPTGTDLESTNAEDAIKELESNFQAGVDAVYNAVVAKGSTPASHSLSDIIAAIAAIPTGITPSGTLPITTNGTMDVTNYKTVSVAVPQYTWTVKNEGSRQISLRVYKDGTQASFFVWGAGAECTMNKNGTVTHT